MPDINFNRTSEDIDKEEMLQTLNSALQQIKELSREVKRLDDKLKEHKHYGYDGTEVLDGDIKIKSGNYLSTGVDYHLSQISNQDASNELTRGFWSVGRDDEKSGLNTTQNAQMTFEHQGNDTTNYFSFLYAFRPPLYINKGVSITNGGNTLSDSTFNWNTNELSGAYINVTDDYGTLESHIISSNTSSQITISDTWGVTTGTYSYTVWRPVYLGGADYPWKRIYTDEGTGGGVRFGISATNDGTNGLLYMDSAGDLYWRNKAGASTKLN